MALVKLSTASQMSGTVGGNVYAKNRYGNYVRGWKKPTNPNTAAQSANRDSMAAANVAWSALTPDVQQGWNTYAAAVPWLNRIGDTVYLTGKSMFVRTFIARANAGLSMVATYPVNLILPTAPDGVLTAAGTAGSISYAFTGTQNWNALGGAIAIYGSGVSAASVNFIGPAKFREAIKGAATPVATPIDVAVYDYLGQAGNKVRLSARAILPDGRISSLATVVVTIGA